MIYVGIFLLAVIAAATIGTYRYVKAIYDMFVDIHEEQEALRKLGMG
jgi:hypothetical protein